MPVRKPERNLLSFLDRAEEGVLSGWAVDFDNPAESLKLRVIIDDVITDVLDCDLRREDSRLVNLANDRIGFTYEIPARFRDGVHHRLCFATLDGALMPMGSRAGGAGFEYSFVLEEPVRLLAVVDGLVDGLIQGWALRVDDRAGTKTGGVRLLAMHEGQPVAEVLADRVAHALAMLPDPDADPGGAAPAPLLVVAGGVAANAAVRAALAAVAARHGARMAAPPPALCGDNAVMVAWAGLERLRRGMHDALEHAPRPRWPLDTPDMRAA
jgi:hypothetical protein